MLTYTFSRREKILILCFAILLLIVVWFVFVFQRTSDEITRLDGEIASVQNEMTLATAKAGKMQAMQAVIDKSKAAGVQPRPVPKFDNMTQLMSELNGIMGITENYSISFDPLDTETSSDYILRGVRIDYRTGSIGEAEAVVRALSQSAFPCSVDSVAISDSSRGGTGRALTTSGGAVSASVHVTFFEKP